MEDPVMLGGIGGGLLLFVLLVMTMLRRRSAVAAESPEIESELTAGIEETGAVEGEEGADSFIDTAANMEVADFEEPEEPEQTDEAAGSVDQVIAEADVYLAYGRYQQAEELIKGAIDENPDRIDLQSKLLEVHFATRDREAFEALAQELHSTLESTGGAEWDKYLLMGKDLCPDNPLFAGASASPPGEESGVPSGALDTGIEFDPFSDAADTETEAPAPEDDDEADRSQAIEFDLSDLDLDEAEKDDDLQVPGAETAVEPAAGSQEDEEALDFDFDFGESAEEENHDLEGTLPLGTGMEEPMSAPEPEESEPAFDPLENSAAGGEGEEDLSLDFDIGEADETPSAELAEEDFDLALHTIRTEAEEIDQESATQTEGETELGLPETNGESVEADIEPPAAGGDTSSIMEERDFSIEWDITGIGPDEPEEGTATDAVQPGEEAVSEDMESTAILDFTSVPLDEESSSEDADMVATKLDLAKAYIDMGDSDGARNILEEVASEGNDGQRQEAESLLNQL